MLADLIKDKKMSGNLVLGIQEFRKERGRLLIELSEIIALLKSIEDIL